jgi:hypothetical protein
LKRRGAGNRNAPFVTDDFDNVNTQLPEAQNLGKIDSLEDIVETNKIDPIVITVHKRRDTFPTVAV